MLKTAASVNQLIAGMRRLKVLKVPPKAIPSVGAGSYRISNSVSKPYFYQVAAYPKKVPLAGNIMLPKGVGGSVEQIRKHPHNQGSVSQLVSNLSGDGKKAVNAVVGMHEGFERGVKANEVSPTRRGHLSLKVLLNEHNTVSKLTGPGSEEAKNVFKALRENTGDTEELQHTLKKIYGPRALDFLKPGNKIPAAMRRNFARTLHNSSMAKADELWGNLYEEAGPWLKYRNIKDTTKLAALKNAATILLNSIS